MKGRKRHIPVDTLGLTVAVVVTPANEGERKGLKVLLEDYFEKGVTRLRKIWVDAGYSGVAIREQVRKLKKTHQIGLEVNENEGKGFNVIKRRQVVERTSAWIFNFRRNSKDYETATLNSEVMIQISMINILIRRLA
ncbi:transposase [Desulfococcaceae bacterium HSG9]|nr:transposase [Desulfococcaceae bacterium HSG9]